MYVELKVDNEQLELTAVQGAKATVGWRFPCRQVVRGWHDVDCIESTIPILAFAKPALASFKQVLLEERGVPVVR